MFKQQQTNRLIFNADTLCQLVLQDKAISGRLSEFTVTQKKQFGESYATGKVNLWEQIETLQ